MSLHAAAKHLSTKGRGSDSMLVHMTPKEVHGLQALAKASGGSLSINPDTGLVEAGFLSKILPVVAAAAATYFTAGAAAPALAAAMGGSAAATAGASILAGAGSGALINGGMAAIQGKDVGEAALSGGLGGAISGGLGAYGGAPDITNGAFMPSGTPPVGTVPVTTPSVPSFDVNAGVSQGVTGFTPPNAIAPPVPSPNAAQLVDNSIYGGQGMSPTAALTQNAGQAAQPAVANAVQPAAINASGGTPYNVNPAASQKLLSEATLAPKPDLLSGNYYQGLGDGGLDTAQKLGIQALPVMSQLEDQQNLVPTAEDPSKLKRISADFRAQDPTKPNPYYKARYAASGGLMDLRPQTNFANPSSYSQGTSQYSIATDPMSGNIAERMARGGIARLAEGGIPIEMHGTADISGQNSNSSNGYSAIGSGYGAGVQERVGSGVGSSTSPIPAFGQLGRNGLPETGIPQQYDFSNGRQYGAPPTLPPPGFTPKPEEPSLVSEVGRPDFNYRREIAQRQMQPQVEPMQLQPPMQDFQYEAPQQEFEMVPGPNGLIKAPKLPSGFAYASGGDVTKKKRASLTSDRSLAAMDPYEAGLASLNNARYGANMSGIISPSQMTRLGEIPTAAGGGLSHLGGYSDGGRMLKGPGDGMSDNIPATIGSKQPARLADGEFVVPADVVSHLGNGSTDAGAKKLYAMMDKVRRARTGKKAQGRQINPNRFLPA